MRNFSGAVNVLIGKSNFQEVGQEPLMGPKVVTGGSMPPNLVELSGSQRLSEIPVSARKAFDYVLSDTHPKRLASDTVVLAT